MRFTGNWKLHTGNRFLIYGIGTDLLRISRGEQLWQRFGDKAADKLLHPLERAQFDASPRRGHFLARAFAAKEAFVKALGTGFRGVGFSDVGVTREPDCRPQFVFSAGLQVRLDAMGIRAAHLSLSDDGDFVFAFAVLETGG
ncbi:MAG: 4-phosphopantetheinyl transferase [Nevskia sp.]|nr:4-phosphopantetheinyl transferase [Nevskia sp.]